MRCLKATVMPLSIYPCAGSLAALNLSQTAGRYNKKIVSYLLV